MTNRELAHKLRDLTDEVDEEESSPVHSFDERGLFMHCGKRPQVWHIRGEGGGFHMINCRTCRKLVKDQTYAYAHSSWNLSVQGLTSAKELCSTVAKTTPRRNEMKQVIVSVKEGKANVFYASDGVEVEIVNFDNAESEADETMMGLLAIKNAKQAEEEEEEETEKAKEDSSEVNSRFKVGDVVKHEATNAKGVVTKVHERCVNPEHNGLTHLGRFWDDCEMEPTEEYDISNGFEPDACRVNGTALALYKKKGF